MTWQRHFNRARQSLTPVGVDKQSVGPLPPGFEPQGLSINGVWGVYKRQQDLETITITELPGQFYVSVSNITRGNYEASQSRGTINQVENKLRRLALLAVLLGGTAVAGKVLSSWSSPSTDPKQVPRVFISHSWRYEDHFEEVKEVLDEAYEFEYFDHSVSSDEPLDAQLPNHLLKKLRDRIRSTSVVLVLAGMYVNHSQVIQDEIEIASEMGKPIIGVIPPENEKVPRVVKEHATEFVRADEILDAIERQT